MTEDTCYPPDDPRHISPEELRNASIEVKIAYRRVVEDKRRSDIEAEKVVVEKEKVAVDKSKVAQISWGKWLGAGVALFGTFAGLYAAFYIKTEKDNDVQSINEQFEDVKALILEKTVAQERLLYVGGACEKMLKYHRDVWATCKINNEILKNQE